MKKQLLFIFIAAAAAALAFSGMPAYAQSGESKIASLQEELATCRQKVQELEESRMQGDQSFPGGIEAASSVADLNEAPPRDGYGSASWGFMRDH